MRAMLFISFIFLQLLAGCAPDEKKAVGKKSSTAFYHWKTQFAPTQSEWNIIEQNKVQNIYLRFFDVAWDATYNKPNPIAQVRIADTSLLQKNHLQIIPTVFITNECIKFINADQCKALAQNIYQLITSIAAANEISHINEIQIDCDWTASTKEKYFSILTELQKIDTVHLYSATIRLFQVKYVTEAGVPPVKKGLLMCYNMGNLKSIETSNSILDPKEVKKYTSNLDKYPLPLDVALPLFDWYILYRNKTYTGIIQNLQKDSLNKYATKIANNRFQVNDDIVLNNVSLKKADVLRYEGSSYKDIMATASIIKQKIKGDSLRLALYHLDSITLSKYSDHEIEAIFRSLR